MRRTISRTDLYELVWSEPIRDIATRFGLSDVGFVKHCKKAAVPVPGRGYWAKIAAGQTVLRPELPARGLGMAEMIEFGGSGRGYLTDEELRQPIPLPPQFCESMEQVEIRATTLIGRAPSAANLDTPHRLIARLVAKDDEKKKKAANSTFVLPWEQPQFETPFEKRRLRILNALFIALERAGSRPDVRIADSRDMSVRVGEMPISLALDRIGAVLWDRDRQPHHKLKGEENEKRMTLAIRVWNGEGFDGKSWEDDDNGRLESKLGECAAQILVLGEHSYRSWTARQYEWRLERKATLEKEDERRRTDAEKKAQEQQAKIRKDRVDRLLREADDHRRANEIRSYVANVRELCTDQRPGDTAAVSVWAEWALAAADGIDPLVSGRFLKEVLPDPTM